MTTAETLAALRKPFDPERISWRVGAVSKTKPVARALAYIDARDVMERLDEVMGADWQCEYIPMPNGTCCCRIGLFIAGEWRWRSNGAGATDVEGEKGSYSDAFKRAAVLWGIGQYLYALDSPWVNLDERKQIAESEMPKLRALLARSAPAKRVVYEQEVITEAIPQRKPAAVASISKYRDPKASIMEKSPNPTDSEAVFNACAFALSFCESVESLQEWGAANGRQSDKWPLMHKAHQDALFKMATEKLAEIKNGKAA